MTVYQNLNNLVPVYFGLALGNFIAQILTDTPNLHKAVERTFFQLIALFCASFVLANK